ncbi:MAG: chemotaxis protein CheW [Zymomonas mobilis]|uniref:chemotaxis protein CheW n=1 Tax=Zymomonas mobilis TaxID=542 RepID=UPI0039E8E403
MGETKNELMAGKTENTALQNQAHDWQHSSGARQLITFHIGEQLQGLIVDAVNDIVTARHEDLQPVPDVGESTAARFLEGLVTIDDRMIMVLALDRLRENGLPIPDQAE